jgi:putative ABC transport system substrate-binding protein
VNVCRKAVPVAFSVLLLVTGSVEAQRPRKVARICYLGNSTTTDALRFRERLRELGHVEGQNITIDSRHYAGKLDDLHDLATELVRLECDVIVTAGTEAAGAAKKATTTIPIVMAFGGDAVKLGYVASLAMPGGNVTGMTGIGAELTGKRLELLGQIIPKLSRVAFITSPSNPTSDFNEAETERVGQSLRLEVQSMEVKTSHGIEEVFESARKRRIEAFILDSGGFFASHQKLIIDAAVKNRLPGIYGNSRYVEAGGLIAYGNDRQAQFRRAAEYVDKILKGTKPAELPVERPSKFELMINLKTAKQIGLTIPPNVLARADRVIR